MKSSLLTVPLLLAFGLTAQAQIITTYLVNFGPTGSAQFSGSPSIFEDSTLTPLPASTIIVNPDSTDENYTLGTATLTLTGNTYSFGVNGTDQTSVTHSFAYQNGGGQNTFTLTGLTANEIVTFEFLGSSQPFQSLVAVQAGTTAPTVGTLAVAEAADGATPVFTSYGSLTGSTSYSGVFTQAGAGEGDISAVYISVQTVAAPEPSAYVMMGAGFFALLFINQRRSLQRAR